MGRTITRRDFLNGVALTVGAAMLPSDLLASFEFPPGPEKGKDYYPPVADRHAGQPSRIVRRGPQPA